MSCDEILSVRNCGKNELAQSVRCAEYGKKYVQGRIVCRFAVVISISNLTIKNLIIVIEVEAL